MTAHKTMQLFKKNTEKKKNRKKTNFLTNLMIGEERDFFIENLSMLISTGIGISSALHVLKKDVRTSQMKRIIDQIGEDIDEGFPIWEALGNSKFLPEQVISLIKMGEDSGKLPENLLVVIKQQRKEKSFRSKIRSAMAYPVFILMIALVVGTSITWFILPKLTSVFDKMNIELPLLTRLLIGASNFLQKNGLIAVPLAFLAIFTVLFFLFSFKKTKFIGQGFMLHFPGIKTLLKEVELASFGHSFGTMLKAGLPIDYALKTMGDITTLISYKKMYLNLSKSLSDGTSLQDSINAYPHSRKKIPGPIQQMIGAGEQSGNLDSVLIKIGEIYEEKLENTTKNIAVILEPALLFLVWIGVVIIALAIISPIYSLIGNINKKDNTGKPAISRPANKNDKEKSSTKIKIIFSNIKIYTKADKNSAVIKVSKKGEIYKKLNEKDGWYELQVDPKTTGWINSRYTSEQD